MKRRVAFLIIPLLICLSCFIGQEQAFAGGGETGNGTADGVAGTYLYWEKGNANGGPLYIQDCPDSTGSPFSEDAVRLYAYVKHIRCGSWYGEGYNNAIALHPNNFGSYERPSLEADLLDAKLVGGYQPTSWNGQVAYTSWGAAISLLWTDPDRYTVVKTRRDTTTDKESFIVYLEDGEPSHSIDDTSKKMSFENNSSSSGIYHYYNNETGDKHAKWLYYNGKTGPYTYTYKTDPDDMNDYEHLVNMDTEKVKVVTETVTDKTYETTYDEEGHPNGKELVRVDVTTTTTYTVLSYKENYETVKYKVKNNTIKQTKYCPMNLNRLGAATEEDIEGFGSATKKIAMTLGTSQNTNDNSPIKTLDVNNDYQFTANFKNDTFGMPSSYDWYTEPIGLEQDYYEDVRGSEYCNGKYSSNSDGSYRYNLKFTASVTSLSTKAGESTASLLLYGKDGKIIERVANRTPFKYSYNPDNPLDTSNGWGFRAVLTGGHTTDHTKDSSGDYPYWWLNTYSQLRYYEYGTKYSITYKRGGIQEPDVIIPDGAEIHYGSDSDGDPVYRIITNASNAKRERGLYVGMAKADYKQPVLYAKWEVNTVAADVI